MRFYNKKVLAALALIPVLGGCGSYATTSSGTTTASSGTTTTTSSVSSASFTPTASYSYTVQGNGSVTIPQSFVQNGKTVSIGINTDSILQVRVRSGAAGTIVIPANSIFSGTTSNFSGTYGCVTYNVTVGGQTVTTETLSVDGANNTNCPGAPDNQVIDFSSQLTKGHGAMFITVSAPRYDYYCQLLEDGLISYSYYSTYCPLHTVYQTHTITGTLDIETNS